MTQDEIVNLFNTDKVKSSLDIAGGVFIETDLVHEIVKVLQQETCENAPTIIEADRSEEDG